LQPVLGLPTKTKEDALKLGAIMDKMTEALQVMPEHERQQLALRWREKRKERDREHQPSTAGKVEHQRGGERLREPARTD